jgi:peptidoglycan/xylan/chitin deacetylase (PgdA/CDA1 family)
VGAIEKVRGFKTLARRWAAHLYARSPAFLCGLRDKVTIVTYHRVLSTADMHRQFVQPGMYVSDAVFESQVRFLTRHFKVIAFSELLWLWQNGGWDSGSRYCVITFDDGWIDTYGCAFPILRRHRIPATVFLPTAYIGTWEWFWPDKLGWLSMALMQKDHGKRQVIIASLRQSFPWLGQVTDGILRGDADSIIECCKAQDQQQIDACLGQWAAVMHLELPPVRLLMNWEEAREMSAAGVEFGSHSVSHRIMTNLSREAILSEARDSWASLRQQGLNPIPVFCYPNGNWSAEVAECVALAGYRAATTTEFGYESATPGRMFGLKRVNIHHDITSTDDLFAFHLAGFNSLNMY